MIFVMLIWVGVSGDMHSGAAATINGFETQKACEASREQVENFYNGVFYSAQTKCVALPAR